jgi:DNA-binding response OmpR family regulator
VLLNLLLPFHGGMEVLARMRQTPGWADVPVLIVSSLDKGEEIARAFRAGADDFVTKPFNPDELLARLSRRLRPPQGIL